MTLFPTTRSARLRLSLFAAMLAVSIVAASIMIHMPGKTFRGPLPPLTAAEAELAQKLRSDVEKLAGEIGERNVVKYRELQAAADFIEDSFRSAQWKTRRIGSTVEGRLFENIEAEKRGTSRPAEIVVVGAHYDSVVGSPGANDNGSGVAGTLALARIFAQRDHARTLRLVAFVNEEPPYFQTTQMGSMVYAKSCRDRNENIVAAISLETIGCYSDEPGSQQYPSPILQKFFPDAGNFIGFVGDFRSAKFVRSTIKTFRAKTQFPSEGIAFSDAMPGIGWSDQWAFWQHGYRAIMITDTAPFRYRHYHECTDTPEKNDYERMARVVGGIETVVSALVNP